ncbi:MAG: RNA 3'-terminal phosphate cyclase [Gemmataceae bacterium]|nr:RNA 3'-terminal phosphate cyclase [Gemmataceae bacterium]
MIEIDGSFGEGGGQILRSSLALSLVTGKPFHLRNLRARRPRPGLQPQHLMSVRAAATVGQATVRGDSKDSSDLTFEPGQVRPGRYQFPIGTAGATSLVLHTLYLPLALRADSPSEITITGGTHVSTSPSFDFLQTTWRGYLELLGLRLKLRMGRPGFYPRGGGVLEAHVQPCARLLGLQLETPPRPKNATGFSAVAGLPEDIARRQARRAANRLKDLGLKGDIEEQSWEGGPGTVLAVVLQTVPVPTLFFGLGERGKRAERVADEAVDQARDFLKADPPGIDSHSADQLVLPLALASGPSAFPVAQVTQHLLTNVDVIRLFVERDVQIEGEEGKPGWVRIT